MSYSQIVAKIKSEFAFFQRLAKETEGASAIEYVLMVGLVALVVVAFGGGIGTQLTTMLTAIETALTPTP